MIETRDGLEHVEEIAATPGLDGLYIGPSDLSLALGLPLRGGPEPVLEDALVRVRDACEAHGLIAGMHCGSGADARRRAAAGFRLVTVGVDSRLYRAAIEHELAEARAT
jgi:4-hydroxy-2-oxoheptanedioate aldolase